MRIGLRFNPRDAGELLRRGQWMQANGREREDITLFALAAKAANDEEPLIVECSHEDEAIQMAEGFVRRGFTRPAIEALTT